MRIAINGMGAGPGASGIGQFARSALSALASTASSDALLAIRGTQSLQLDIPTVEEREVVGCDAWEQLHLPAMLDRWRADVYYSPFLIAPLACNTPVVVTVHDAIPVTHPDLTTPEFLAVWQRWVAPSIRAADHVATVSEGARCTLVEHGLAEPAKVSVLRQSVSPRFRPMPIASLRTLLEPYRLEPDRYVLYLGSIEARKNVATLIRAFLAADTAIPLVLAGHTTRDDPELVALIASDPVRIRHLGAVSDDTASGLMAGARVFVFVSLAEGFGRPLLEALASGVPVVASSIPPLQELAAGAATHVDPDDPAAITRAIERLNSDEGLRAALRGAGLARAAQFTPERFAADLRAIFARAVRS